MTTAPISNVAAGTLPHQQKWASLGFDSRGMSYPLTKMFGMIVGEQNCGKTYLLQSCPDAFIVNCDLSGSPNPNAVSVSWPFVDSVTGNTFDVGKRPMTMTWDAVEAKIAQLVALPPGSDRPGMIVFDTLGGMIRLLQPWVAAQLGRSKFTDCDGRQAWDRLYAHIIDGVCTKLRTAGYGVWIVAHLGRQWKQIDDSKSTEVLDFMIGDGLRARLSSVVEVIVPIVTEVATVPVTKEVVTQLPGGAKSVRKVPTTEKQVVRKIAFEDPAYRNIRRARTPRPLPDIVIPDGGDPWRTLVDEYDRARA